PPRDKVQDALGWLLLVQQQLPEAEAEFRELVRLTPDSACGRRGLTATLLGQKKLVEAEAEAREAIRRDGAGAALQLLLKRVMASQRQARGRSAAENRDWNTAAGELGAAFQHEPPDELLLWFSLGLVRVLADDLSGFEQIAREMPRKLVEQE